MSRRIVILEDDPTLRRQLGKVFASRGFDVTETADCAAFMAAAATRRFDTCLMDMSLPDGDGLDAWERVRTSQDGAVAVAMSGLPTPAVAARAAALAVSCLLAKPLDLATLVAACSA